MKRTYFADLDALRFFAFLIVFFAHCFIYEAGITTELGVSGFMFFLIRVGHNGLSMFFVLSGFLITYLLGEEYQQKGSVNLLHYYQRRILRIFPLFYLLLLFVFLAYPFMNHLLFHKEVKADVTLWNYFVFLNNFDLIKRGANIPTLVILWSVAVEVQFYFIWPLLYILFKKYPLIPIVLMFIASQVFRAVYYNNPDELHYSTFSCMNDLSAGSFLAWLYSSQSKRLIKFFSVITKQQLLVFYTVFVLYLAFWGGRNYSSPAEAIIDRLIVSFGFVFILAEQIISPNSIIKLGKSKLFSKLGIITYGLYCFHYLIIGLIFPLITKITGIQSLFIFSLSSVLALAGTILISSLSYRYYETYFLKLKKY